MNLEVQFSVGCVRLVLAKISINPRPSQGWTRCAEFDRSLSREDTYTFRARREQWILEEDVLVLVETFLEIFGSFDCFFGETLREVSSNAPWDQVGICDSCTSQTLGEINEEFAITQRPHEHRRMTQEHSVNGEPVEVAHDPIHFIQQTSKILSTRWRLNTLEFFDRPYPGVVQVRRVDY